MTARTALVILLAGALVILFILFPLSAGVLTDWLWFDSQGFSSIYWTILRTKLIVFFAFAILFLVAFSLSLQVARALSLRRAIFFNSSTSISLRGMRYLLLAVALDPQSDNGWGGRWGMGDSLALLEPASLWHS